MWDVIKVVLGAIIPPKDPTPERLRLWGFAVMGMLVAMTSWTAVNTVVMLGLMPALFGPGYVRANVVADLARANDLKMIQQSLDSLITQQKAAAVATLGQQIYNLHIMECNARKARNFDLAKNHADTLEGLKFNFRMLAGYDYLLQPCSEL